MTLLDKIKSKTSNTSLKMNNFIHDHGVDFGMGVGALGVAAGIIGVGAMVATTGGAALAVSAPLAALASGAGITVLGTSVNLAGASILVGGYTGVAMAGFAKIYKSMTQRAEAPKENITAQNQGVLAQLSNQKPVNMDELDYLLNITPKAAAPTVSLSK